MDKNISHKEICNKKCILKNMLILKQLANINETENLPNIYTNIRIGDNITITETNCNVENYHE